VEQEMRNRITGGIYLPGEMLPPVRELAAEFGVCDSTMRKALMEVRAAGLLASRQGLGWQACPRASQAGDSAAVLLFMSVNLADRGQGHPTILIYQLIEQYAAQYGRRFYHCQTAGIADFYGLARVLADCPAPQILLFTNLLQQFAPHDDFWVLLAEMPKRIVWFDLGTFTRMIPFDLVTFDWLTGTEAAVDSMIRRGCRRLLFAGYDGINWSDERRGGFLRALRHRGMWELGAPQPCFCPPCETDRPDGQPDGQSARHLAVALRDHLRTYTADGILCAHDRIAETLMDLAGSLPLPLLVGHDNTIWAAEHGISSVTVNAHLFVTEAFRVLDLPPASPPRVVRVPTMLIER